MSMSSRAGNGGKPADAGERAFQEIRRRILEGHYAPGSRLTESELAEVVGVSRTPVRSALVRLDAEGLVELIPNRGAFVARWTEMELDHIFGLRIVLESYGAKLAAVKITEAEVDALRDLADRMDAALEGQARGYIDVCTDLNNEFHFTILRATANRRLTALLGGVYELPLIHRTISRYSTEHLWRSWSQHRELISAFEHHDAEWAEAVMRAHILAARAVTIQATAEILRVDDLAAPSRNG